MDQLTWSTRTDTLLAKAEREGLGRLEVEPLVAEALALCERFGTGSRRQARTLLVQARHRVHAKRFPEALAVARQGVEVARVNGGEPLLVAPMISDLAAAAPEPADLDQVAALATVILPLPASSAQPDAHVAWAHACHAIATALVAQGGWPEAEAWYRAAVDRWKRSGRGAGGGPIQPLMGLASVLWRLGRREEAIDACQKAVAAQEEMLGFFDPELARTLAPLGAALVRAGQGAAAVEVGRRVATLLEDAAPPSAAALRPLVAGFAAALSGIGEQELALRLTSGGPEPAPAPEPPRTVAVTVTSPSAVPQAPAPPAPAHAPGADGALDPDDLHGADRARIATLLAAGRHREAAALCAELAPLEVMPADRARVFLSLGRALCGMGRTDDAEAAYERALALARGLDAADPDGQDLLGEVLAARADLERCEERLDVAEKLAREAVARRAGAGGEESWQAAHARIVLARVLHERGAFHEAGAELRRAAAVVRRGAQAAFQREVAEAARELGLGA